MESIGLAVFSYAYEYISIVFFVSFIGTPQTSHTYHCIKVNLKAGWWQLKYFLCSPRSLGKSMIQFDEHIFQLGWFNHQLAKPRYKTNMTSSAAPKPGGFLCGLDGEWSGSPRCVSWT